MSRSAVQSQPPAWSPSFAQPLVKRRRLFPAADSKAAPAKPVPQPVPQPKQSAEKTKQQLELITTTRQRAGSPEFVPPNQTPRAKRRLSDGDDGTDEKETETTQEETLDDYKPLTMEDARPAKPTNQNGDAAVLKKKAQMFRAVGKQTSKELTFAQEKLLKQVYYTEGFTTGRDALWYKLKDRANCPTWRQVADWVNRQAVSQRFSLARKHGGLVNSFVPPPTC